MIVGDPSAMRQLADKLVRYADDLRHVPKDVSKAFGKADMQGPWADTLESTVKGRSRGFGTAADQLDAAARSLRSSATKVEEAIEAERRRQAAIAEAARQAELERHAAAARATAAAAASAARKTGK